jgi:WD40 repeat protein
MWRCIAIPFLLAPVWTRAFDPTQLNLAELRGDPSFLHAGTITHVHVLADGHRVLTAARDGTARIWDLETGNELRRFLHPEGADVWFALPILKDAQLITAGGHKAVTLWDMASGKELKSYPHSDTVFRLAVNADASLIAATDRDDLCLLWDRASGEKAMELKGHSSSVYSVFFLDGKEVITASNDKSVRRWDVRSGEELDKINRNTGCIYTLALASNRKRFLVFTADSGVECWTSDGNKAVWTAAFPEDVRDGTWSPKGDRVAAICDDAHLYILDGKTGAELHKIPLPGKTHYGVDFSIDGKQVLCGCEQLLCRFDVESGERMYPAPGPVKLGYVKSFHELPDGKRTIELGSDKGILLRNKADHSLIETWLPGVDINNLSLHRASNRLVAAAEDGVAYMLDLASGETVNRFNLGTDVNQVRFYDEGRKLATAGDNKRLVSWDVASGERILKFKGHKSSVRWIEVSQDNRRLLSISSDKTLRVWDLMSGTLLATLSGNEEVLSVCRVHPRDHRSIIAAGKKALYYWPVKPPKARRMLQPEDVAKLVSQLGASRFAVRESATRHLLTAGEAIIEQLAEMQSDDPEVNHRLERIRAANLGNNLYEAVDHVVLRLEGTCSNFNFHPDGVHWVCTEGAGANVTLVFGAIKEGKLVILHRIPDPNSPHGLLFVDEKTLRTTNRNGTFGFYR